MSTKIFNLIGEIDGGAVAEFTKFTTEVLLGNPNDNIVISINSQGGNYISAMSIYDMIKALPNPVYTVIAGNARSMAAILALSARADRRFCLRNSNIYIHSVKVSRIENAGIFELKQTLKDITNFNLNVENIFKKATHIPEDKLHHVLLEDENDFIQYKSHEMEDLGIAMQLDGFETIINEIVRSTFK